MKVYVAYGTKGRAEIDEFFFIGVYLSSEEANNATKKAADFVREELKKPCPVSKAAAKKYESLDYPRDLFDEAYDSWIDWKLNYLRADAYNIDGFNVQEFDTDTFYFRITP
jgi:hypothetical protein